MMNNKVTRIIANSVGLAAVAALGITVYQLGTSPVKEKTPEEKTENVGESTQDTEEQLSEDAGTNHVESENQWISDDGEDLDDTKVTFQKQGMYGETAQNTVDNNESDNTADVDKTDNAVNSQQAEESSVNANMKSQTISEDQADEAAETRRLVRRDETRHHAADDDAEEDEGADKALERVQALAPSDVIFARCDGGVFADPQDDRDDEEDRQDHTGDDAGDEERADALLRHRAVEDHRGGGRDEEAKRTARGDAAGGEPIVIAVFAHLGDGDGAHRGGGRLCGAADGAEERAGEHGAAGKTAWQTVEPLAAALVKISGYAGDVGIVAHQDEQGNDGERIVRCIRVGRHGEHVDRTREAVRHHIADEAGEHQRKTDVDAHRQRDDEDQQCQHAYGGH